VTGYHTQKTSLTGVSIWFRQFYVGA